MARDGVVTVALSWILLSFFEDCPLSLRVKFQMLWMLSLKRQVG